VPLPARSGAVEAITAIGNLTYCPPFPTPERKSQKDDPMLPHSVDLVIFGQVSDPDLKAHIQQAGVVFYQRGALTPAH